MSDDNVKPRGDHKSHPPAKRSAITSEAVEAIADRVVDRITPASGISIGGGDRRSGASAAEVSPSTRVKLTVREIVGGAVGLVIAAATIVGIYYMVKTNVAAAETAVASVTAKTQDLDRQLRGHEIDLKVAQTNVSAIERDLDRRFAEIKEDQSASERRILLAIEKLERRLR